MRMIMFLKSPFFWMYTASASMLANAFLFFGIVDSGVTHIYTMDSKSQTELERDVIAAACNTALAGGRQTEVLRAISSFQKPWKHDHFGWIADGVQLAFEDHHLERLRFGDELDEFEDSLYGPGQRTVSGDGTDRAIQ